MVAPSTINNELNHTNYNNSIRDNLQPVSFLLGLIRQAESRLKIYLLLQFLSNLIQIFTVYSSLNFKSFECRKFFILRKSPLFSKKGVFF